jgi:hypothetical protein
VCRPFAVENENFSEELDDLLRLRPRPPPIKETNSPHPPPPNPHHQATQSATCWSSRYTLKKAHNPAILSRFAGSAFHALPKNANGKIEPSTA